MNKKIQYLKDKEVREFLTSNPSTLIHLVWKQELHQFHFYGVNPQDIRLFQIITWNHDQIKTAKSIDVAITIAKDLGFKEICFKNVILKD